ncbi:hypothetical protein Aph02nite_37660 [Actinoplanes philippinensis]|uniref:Uncharacterized protein n=1 Tax=Actinoplanes philippinensis TaxID=35752 RepID=A0A1I2FL74_9ACTN|nr:hypothetical protein [Actinoplanes philippinensis]GIE77816.1 hypothetical protein Aph02nite_37660 [Actinoplanes philippinensis]SFF05360.1 hypothetical protein SAMN05421541_105453 [Actinoplanes philippinensis]
MTTPGDIALLIVLAAALMACAGYAAGRLHQRRQSGPDLRNAYKTGYDAATRSVFSMAARAAGKKPDEPETPEVPGQREGRHAVPEELVRAKTYRLSFDRVARAKVPRQTEAVDEPAKPDADTRTAS